MVQQKAQQMLNMRIYWPKTKTSLCCQLTIKGKATVVMDRADYDAKVGQMLNDENTYQLLKKDPTASLERKMNLQLLYLVRVGRLHNDVYLRLRSSAGRTPLLYGLPKVHKPSVLLRPIVSFLSSPTYHLSKFLADLLQPVVGKTSSHVKNSREFVDFIRSERLTSEETMISFDVVSLFTCVPTILLSKWPVADWGMMPPSQNTPA